MMTIIAMKCPQCGGDIEFEQSRSIMYCKYCGTKVTRGSDGGCAQRDAQYYYENWIKLRSKLKDSKWKDYVTRKAFDELDVEFAKYYCDDYRRLYVEAIVLTQDFAPRSTFTSDLDNDNMPTNVIKTYVNIGGMGKEKEIKDIRDRIAALSRDEQAASMVKKIDDHLAAITAVKREIIPGTANTINQERKIKGFWGLFL